MRTIVITGANSGIGKEIARLLLKEENEVVAVVKRSKKSEQAFTELNSAKSPHSKLLVEYCDLSNLDEVSLLVDRLKSYPRIDVLINNAGLESSERRESPQGFELSWAVNFLAPVMLTTSVIPKLLEHPGARVIFTSSLVEKWGVLDFADLQMRRGYNPEKAYYRSKLALLIYAYSLARRYSPQELAVFTFEPGLTKTEFTRDFRGIMKLGASLMRLFMQDPTVPAQTAVFLATGSEVSGLTGKNFFRKKEKITSAQSHDLELAEKLMSEAQKQLGISLFT